MERIKSFRGCPIRGAMLALIAMLMTGGCDGALSEQAPDQAQATPHSQAQSDQVAHADSGQFDDDPAYRDVPAPLAIADHALLHPASDPNAACTCGVNRYHNGWCPRCNVGYVAGRLVKSTRFFEGVDPHGHTLNPETFHVSECSEAAQNNEWCPAISMGFVGGQLYFTRLTWGVAKGKPVVVERLSCDICRASGGDQPRWCDACERGIVGTRAFFNRELFDRTAAEFSTMLAALEKAPSCDYCAVAMVAHQVCPVCRISYQSTSPKQIDSAPHVVPVGNNAGSQ